MNIGIFAHVDAGKTTITENLLYQAGVINEIGRVDSGNTVTDKMELEKKRGITIQSTPISFEHNNVKINLIDTPGHVEFIAEVERAMGVLDGAVLVISAKEGVQSHTTLLFESLNKLKIPVIIFVNKIDRSGINIKELYKTIQNELTSKVIGLHDPVLDNGNIEIGELFESSSILEELSLLDDDIMEKYLNDIIIGKEDIIENLQTMVAQNAVYPICYGSALNSIGTVPLLDAIVKLLPKLHAQPSGSLEGVVFKILRNSQKKREVYVRLYSGVIRSREMLGDEKVTFIKRMENGKLEFAKEAYGNDIVVLMGLDNLKVGDTIGSPKQYKSISLGTPTLRTRISSENKRELAQILDALAESDPFLEYEIEAHSKDLYLNLFGEIQMEIIQALIKNNYGVEVSFSEPVVIFKEMPNGFGEYALYIYTDAHPFAATVGIRIEPNANGIVINSEVPTGHLPQTFQNGIVDGIHIALREGLKGWEVTNARITITEGEFNSVDSTPSAYRNLTPMVLMEALNIAKSKLLWPVNQFKVKIAREHYGKIMSDLLSMKASDVETIEENDKILIKGVIPVETSYDYEKRFVSITSGLGIFSQSFYKYVETPVGINKERAKNYVDPLNRGKYLLSKLNAM